MVISGHSSGGLIASYIAAYSDVCGKLILEDPPFFSSQGERRFKTYNYLDLSSVCHRYNEEYIESGVGKDAEQDFVLFYFTNQMAWDFFPDKSREKIKKKSIEAAEKFRKNHPHENLKIPFWPKSALAGFVGMDRYDPYFGEAFYDNSFHAGIDHEEMLKKISCETIIMKAKTNQNKEGVLLAAMSDEDVNRAAELIRGSKIVHFSCGHGIHAEKEKEFVKCF